MKPIIYGLSRPGVYSVAAILTLASVLGIQYWIERQTFLAAGPLLASLTRDPIIAWTAIVGAALINALFEELLWRGVLLNGIRETWSTTAAVGLTAIGFGLAHWAAVPSGTIGVALTAAFGLIASRLVTLRQQFLAATFISHAAADIALLANLEQLL